MFPKTFFYPEHKSNNNNKSNNNKSNKLIHYMVDLDFLLQNEIENSKSIKQKIDDYDWRFFLFNTSESLRIAEIDSASEPQFARSNNNNNNNNILLTFENRPIIYLDVYLKSLSCSRKYIFQIIEFYRYQLLTIDLLVSINMVHNNICLNTIVIDSFENPLLTNFRFSIDLNTKTHVTHIISEKNYDSYILPEFCLLKYQLSNKLESLSMYNIEKVIKQFIVDHTILNTFGPKIVNDYMESALLYFSKYSNKSYDQNVSDVLLFSSTWDNYALSIVYLKILIGLHRVINVNNKFIILFMKLLVNNIHPDPSKRQSIKQTSERFELMIDDIDNTEFIDLIKLL